MLRSFLNAAKLRLNVAGNCSIHLSPTYVTIYSVGCVNFCCLSDSRYIYVCLLISLYKCKVNEWTRQKIGLCVVASCSDSHTCSTRIFVRFPAIFFRIWYWIRAIREPLLKLRKFVRAYQQFCFSNSEKYKKFCSKMFDL